LAYAFTLLAPAVVAQMASGETKFVGNVPDGSVLPLFLTYWNQITPENAGKLLINDFDILNNAQKLKLEELFPVFWEHPLVKGITFWGYREGAIWQTNGFLLRADNSERPAMIWLKDYLKKNS
jgi:hypothetical protein